MRSEEVLNYRVLGDGHPVVFLHGFMESLTMWDYLHPENFPFQSILIDLPGHGDSPISFEQSAPSIEEMAQKVAELLTRLGTDHYDVVGHSMGGYVALALKEKYTACGKVILLNSNFWEDPEQKKIDRVRVADLAIKAKDLFVSEAIPGLFYAFSRDHIAVKSLIKEAKEMSGEAIAFASLAMRNRPNRRSVIETFEQDILILQGVEDPLIAQNKMLEMLGDLKPKLIFVQGAGHMSHIEQPEIIQQEINRFLA